MKSSNITLSDKSQHTRAPNESVQKCSSRNSSTPSRVDASRSTLSSWPSMCEGVVWGTRKHYIIMIQKYCHMLSYCRILVMTNNQTWRCYKLLLCHTSKLLNETYNRQSNMEHYRIINNKCNISQKMLKIYHKKLLFWLFALAETENESYMIWVCIFFRHVLPNHNTCMHYFEIWFKYKNIHLKKIRINNSDKERFRRVSKNI